jgi:hypothetical protein
MRYIQESVVDDAALRDVIANVGGQMAGKARAYLGLWQLGYLVNWHRNCKSRE